MKSTLLSPDLSPDTAEAIRVALATLEESGTKIYDRKKQQVYRFQAAGLKLIAKVYEIKSLSRTLAAVLGFSRTRRSFRASVALRKAGIRTPKSLMLIEEGAPFLSSSILVTEFCDGPPLRHLLDNKQAVPPTMASDIHEMLLRMRSIKFSHGDFHSLNLLITENGNPHLIDLDSVRRRFLNRTATMSIENDRDRLLGSFEPYPDFYQTLINQLGEPGTPLLDR